MRPRVNAPPGECGVRDLEYVQERAAADVDPALALVRLYLRSPREPDGGIKGIAVESGKPVQVAGDGGDVMEPVQNHDRLQY